MGQIVTGGSSSDPSLETREDRAPLATLERTVDARDLVEGEDYYWEGSSMVFTASYLLARGYCCGSGCRHCPWGGQGFDSEAPTDPQPR